MFRKSYVILVIIIIIAGNGVCWSADYDFRRTRWGMSQEEVLKSEDMEPAEKAEQMLRYDLRILGRNVELHYSFADDKLIGAFYKLKDNYLKSDHFISAYNEFKAALAKKYGPPKEEKINWNEILYKNAPSKRGLALSLGHVGYDSFWETSTTTIKCSLKEENYDILCMLEYVSKEFNHLSKFLVSKKELDPF